MVHICVCLLDGGGSKRMEGQGRGGEFLGNKKNRKHTKIEKKGGQTRGEKKKLVGGRRGNK